jgi:hypothetical protein
LLLNGKPCYYGLVAAAGYDTIELGRCESGGEYELVLRLAEYGTYGKEPEDDDLAWRAGFGLRRLHLEVGLQVVQFELPEVRDNSAGAAHYANRPAAFAMTKHGRVSGPELLVAPLAVPGVVKELADEAVVIAVAAADGLVEEEEYIRRCAGGNRPALAASTVEAVQLDSADLIPG